MGLRAADRFGVILADEMARGPPFMGVCGRGEGREKGGGAGERWVGRRGRWGQGPGSPRGGSRRVLGRAPF
jgi:hypothetical protein